jgi:iron complex transport system permease protein
MTASRAFVVLAALVVLVLISLMAALTIGSTPIPLSHVVAALLRLSDASDGQALVVEAVRLPRALTALLSGAALATAGLQMQTLFRNPLADPFALGISSGATLGVALVMLGSGYGASAAFGAALGVNGDALIIVAAFGGAAAVLALVLLVSSRIANPVTVLVLGLMFGYAVSAIVTVLVAASQPERLQQWAQWGFGSFAGVPWPRMPIYAAAIGAGLVVACAMTKQLNVLLLGEQYARSLGVTVRLVRLSTMLSASLLGAVVTAFCGPIAFLGIAVPHLCRGLLASSDHRLLIPAVILMGASIALIAQIASLLPGAGGALPLNAVMSIVGAPVVVFVLVRGRRGAFVG